MKFKNKIRQFRIENCLTQTQLGLLIGVSKNTISLYENFSMIPRSDVAFKLMLLFRCDFLDLFYFVDEE